ncbi:hypothetical protein ES703_90830 [subsurface metagenome]
MKQARPRVKKTRTTASREGQHGSPPRIAVGWGRGASEYRPGLFTKQYFEEHGEACCADIYYALSREIERLNKERVEMGEKPFRRPNYSSFARYFHWFVLLDLIERVDRKEPAIYDFLKPRQFYRVTAKGASEEEAWQDPVRAAHPEFAKWHQ